MCLSSSNVLLQEQLFLHIIPFTKEVNLTQLCLKERLLSYSIN
jgi:hypothetical protein